jgi:uncharacterized RDD family membrane protein YckC
MCMARQGAGAGCGAHGQGGGLGLEMMAADQRGAPGRRRLAAFGVDYAFIAAYLGVLVLLGVLGRAAGLLPSRVTTPSGRIMGQLAAIAVLTVPVTLWFAWWEAAPRGATPGKRLLGLRVSRLDGGAPSWPRSLLRSLARIAVPWELAHTGVWNILAWPGPEAPVNAALFAVANGLLVLNLVMLFVGARRPLYDRLAGTVVQAARQPNVMAARRPRPQTVEDGADSQHLLKSVSRRPGCLQPCRRCGLAGVC